MSMLLIITPHIVTVDNFRYSNMTQPTLSTVTIVLHINISSFRPLIIDGGKRDITSRHTTRSNVCMPVVPALAGGKDIFCLLDTGSTSTFVSKKLASKLNLDVTVTNLNLRTLNSSVSKTVDSVNVTIESVDRNFSIDMRSIYVVDSIPTKSYTIDVKAYSHLRDIDFVSTFDHEVDLLIGQDYASCFVPLEIRKGLKNEPYAVRTPLGYVVNGGNGG